MGCVPAYPAFQKVDCGSARLIVQGRPEKESGRGTLAAALQDQNYQSQLGYVYIASMQNHLASKNVNPSSVFFNFPTYHLISVRVNDVFSVIGNLYHQFVNPAGVSLIELIEPDLSLDVLSPQVRIGSGFSLTKGKSKHTDYLTDLNVTAAAGDSADGSGVRVAVIDTGLEPGKKTAASYVDLTQAGNPAQADNDGHGTAMVEIVKAVASGAELHVIRVTNSTNVFVWDLLAAMTTAVYDKNAHIVSLSIGCKDLNDTCGICGGQQGGRSKVCENFFRQIATNSASGHDPIVVAATGNDGKTFEFDWPARYGTVLAVGSVNHAKEVSSFSNMATVKSQHTYCLCPGGEIDESTNTITEYVGEGTDGNAQTFCLGTSPATAYAAGVLALRRHYSELNHQPTDSAALLRLCRSACEEEGH